MGLPPDEYVDSNGWQGVGPQEYSAKGGQSPQAYSETQPLRGQPPTSPSSRSLQKEPETQLQRIAGGSLFQNFTLFVIVLNGLWIGVDVEWNHPSITKDRKIPDGVTLFVENAFCAYFTFEIVIRIAAYGTANIRDKSFIFDFVLVAFMVIETWIMAIIQAIQGDDGESMFAKFSVLRLLRLTRLARIMHSLPELLTLVRGILNAAKAVMVVFVLMVVLMYIFAIVFTGQIGDNNAPEHKMDPYYVTDGDPTAVELFGSMGDSMMSLFTRGLLGDNLAETLQAIKDRGGPYECPEPTFDADKNMTIEAEEPAECREGGQLWLMWVFIVFMIISAFCLLNMLVGILCEVIDGTAKSEMEETQVFALRNNIESAFHAIDTTGDDLIHKSEWESMKTEKPVQDSFLSIGFDHEQLNDQMTEIEEHLFGRLDKTKLLDDDVSWVPGGNGDQSAQVESIPMDTFVSNILDIRPDHDASYLDLYILKTRVERDEKIFNAKLDCIEEMLQERTLGGTGPPSQVPAVEDSTAAERPQSEEPKNGTSPNPWLRGLPTDVLFAELKHRAMRSVNSTLPAIDLS